MDRRTQLRRFKHLLPKEVVLWNIFLDKHLKEYKYFEYDLHVGQGIELAPEVSPMVRKAALALSKKRIDAIGHRYRRITLFEIKPDAGLSAIGQLLAYLYLYRAQLKPRKRIVTHIVSDIIDVDTRRAARAYGINWTTVSIDWNNWVYDKARRTYLKTK